MQKAKPIEYVQAILYHIKCHWRKLIMAVLIVATIILALIWSSTQEDIHYYIAVGAGVITVVVACLAHSQEIGEIVDRLGLRLVPEDEEG